MRTHLLLPLVGLAFVCHSASAEMITFDFVGDAGVDLDGLSSGSTSVSAGGITLTLTATASSGVFNRAGTLGTTDSNFGINAMGTGDDTDAFDSQLGSESMTFSVTSNVALADLTLVSLDFDRFGANAHDEGTITKNGFFLGNPLLVSFSSADLGAGDVLTLNETGIVGTDSIALTSIGTPRGLDTIQGFGLEGITFDATAAAVPEPATFGLLAAGFGGFYLRRKRTAAGS